MYGACVDYWSRCAPLTAEYLDVGVVDKKEAPCAAACSHLKRKYNSEETDMQEGEGCDSMEVGVAGESNVGVFQSKKQCTEPAITDDSPSHSFDLNFPLPGEEGLPCLVKVSFHNAPSPIEAMILSVQVYRDCEAFSVGSVVHVVGVLSVDPALAPLVYSNSGTGNTVEENRAHCPPPALVPRLHAITIKVLPHSNPLLPWDLAFPVHSQSMVLHCNSIQRLQSN